MKVLFLGFIACFQRLDNKIAMQIIKGLSQHPKLIYLGLNLTMSNLSSSKIIEEYKNQCLKCKNLEFTCLNIENTNF